MKESIVSESSLCQAPAHDSPQTIVLQKTWRSQAASTRTAMNFQLPRDDVEDCQVAHHRSGLCHSITALLLGDAL